MLIVGGPTRVALGLVLIVGDLTRVARDCTTTNHHCTTTSNHFHKNAM